MRPRRARLTVLLTALALASCVLPPSPAAEQADSGVPYAAPAAPEPTDEGTAYPAEAAAAPGPVDVAVFRDSLAPYGSWIADPDYGQVWRPAGVDADWRPYTDGRWAYTADYGWTWVAAEPWGWAPYHYGRWLFRPAAGWVWVPGSVWAPAWVDWRSGDGYVGWRPLPPRGFHDNDEPRGWCFVPERSFDATRVAAVIVPPARNVVVIRNTVNVTNYRIINQRIVNRSISVTRIERVTNRPVPHYQANFAGRPQHAGSPAIQGQRLTLYRPASLNHGQPPVVPAVARAQSREPRQQAHTPQAMPQAATPITRTSPRPAVGAVQQTVARAAQPPIVPPEAAPPRAAHAQQHDRFMPPPSHHGPSPAVRRPAPPQQENVRPPVVQPVAARPPKAETHRAPHRPPPVQAEIRPHTTQPEARRVPTQAAPPAVRHAPPAAPAPTKRVPVCKAGDRNCAEPQGRHS